MGLEQVMIGGLCDSPAMEPVNGIRPIPPPTAAPLILSMTLPPTAMTTSLSLDQLDMIIGGLCASPVMEHAKLVLMDTLGIILATSDTAEMTNFSRSIPSSPRAGEATVLRRGFPKTEAAWAALINGTGATFFILDESHPTIGHYAVHIVPAALAMAEKLGLSGRKLIESFVLGYETSARLGSACR